MARAAVLLALLALGAVAVQAQNSPLEVAKANNLGLFGALVKEAAATKAYSDGSAKITILAPTDEAVKAFLDNMKISVKDIQDQEALADHILSYHTIPGKAGPAELFAKGDTTVAPTLNRPYSVTFKKTASGGVTVTDAQGNTANVVKANLGNGAFTVHVIDKVLYSGAYFNNLAALVKFRPDAFSTAAAALERAGLSSALTKEGVSQTVFLPTNAAFEKAGVKLESIAPEALAGVLTYHVVAGARQIPIDFKSGEELTTVEGQKIKIELVTETENGAKIGRAYVVDAKGNKAMVIRPNLFVSRSLYQIVDGVLMPKPAEAKPAAAAAAATTKPAPAAAPEAPAEFTGTSADDIPKAAQPAVYGFVPKSVLDSAKDGQLRDDAAKAIKAASEPKKEEPAPAPAAAPAPEPERPITGTSSDDIPVAAQNAVYSWVPKQALDNAKAGQLKADAAKARKDAGIEDPKEAEVAPTISIKTGDIKVPDFKAGKNAATAGTYNLGLVTVASGTEAADKLWGESVAASFDKRVATPPRLPGAWYAGSSGAKDAAAAQQQFAAAKAAAASGAANIGPKRLRMLLGDGDGVDAYASTISLDSSQQAVNNAVNSMSDPSVYGTYTAAQANQANNANSLMLVHWPEHATYATGVKNGGSIAASSSGGN